MLILAVEPDRRQSKQLTAVVRSRLNAELVLADSADRALESLGDRVPDLVLTSALLSPKDECALSDRLRSFGDATSHVQTLTIPVLAPPQPASRKSGVLSALRWSKRAAPVDGCDPAVFADECAAYLERARVEREQRRTHDADAPAPARVEPPIDNEVLAEMSEFAGAALTAPAMDEDAEATGFDSFPRERTESFSYPRFEPREESFGVGDLSDFPRATLVADVVDQPSEAYQAAAVDEIAPADTIGATLDGMPAEESSVEEARAFDQVDGVWEPLFRSTPEFWPALEGTPSDVVLQTNDETLQPMDVASEPIEDPLQPKDEPLRAADQGALLQMEAAVEIVAPAVEVGTEPTVEAAVEAMMELAVEPMDISEAELMEAVQALQREIDQLDLQEPVVASRQRAAKSSLATTTTSVRKPKQDEWGLFDPEQCGFAALVKKLEEITTSAAERRIGG